MANLLIRANLHLIKALTGRTARRTQPSPGHNEASLQHVLPAGSSLFMDTTAALLYALQERNTG